MKARNLAQGITATFSRLTAGESRAHRQETELVCAWWDFSSQWWHVSAERGSADLGSGERERPGLNHWSCGVTALAGDQTGAVCYLRLTLYGELEGREFCSSQF